MGIDYDADALGFDLNLYVGIAHERVAVIVDEARLAAVDIDVAIRDLLREQRARLMRRRVRQRALPCGGWINRCIVTWSAERVQP